MKILADEGIDKQIVFHLREKGYSVNYIAEMEPGISDEIVLDLANKEGSILLTSDKDFGNLVFRLRRLSAGVVLIRLAGLNSDKKASIVSTVLGKYSRKLAKSFTVVTPKGVRIRSHEKKQSDN